MGTLFQLTGNHVLPAPGVRVLRAVDYASLVEANRLLAMAEQRAAAMASDAEKAYEERRRQGYEDGLMEGRMEQSEKMLETAMQAVEYIEGVEGKLVDVVTSAVRKIIGELDDRECTVRVVRNALAAVRSQQRVLIRVSPDDKDSVRQALAAMISASPGAATFLDVTADPRMKPGDCILECELGVVDASLETQLKAIEHALLSKIRES
ncbi:HrpE/YscL family type III secretion apparatus protein [uncultured Desulfovibrio sp.]|uniref:HrpE/YscL family type III secretion apparatus protein n=1 Tax=uncultured Desulfovibrio sp. TaxID=167968 RepID=UPI0026274E1B|nr:HrpE/YscL family type III secretion apparatus protein [uncultured Desulfovibrio sp.]